MNPSDRRSGAVRRAGMGMGVTVALIGSGLALGAAPAAAASDIPDGHQVVHYAFDDAAGSSVVADTSGNSRNATLVNPTTATSVDGTDGTKALGLPGGASNAAVAYVDLPASILQGRTDLTVSTRVNWTSSNAAWQWMYALGTNTTRYLFSTPRNGDGLLRSAITTNGGGANENIVTGSAVLPGGEWKTLTVTLDTTADRLTSYLDGIAIGSVTTPITASSLLTNSTRSGYIGKSFYPDPYFAGAVDDFAVYDVALTPEQVGGLVASVPTVTGVSDDTLEVRTAVGTAPALPATTLAHYSDGYDRPAAVVWDAVDPSSYAQRGTFVVNGVAVGQAVTATIAVYVPNEITVDLGSDTGAFHGGASGTLYGVYGEDIPSDNLLEGIDLRTVSTKAQDGPQHPGADALEVVKPLADATDGDVYIYMTDIHRGFPYEWEGSTPAEKLSIYSEKLARQVDQVLELPAEYQDNIVFVPFNEPEGNMFGTGTWSLNRVSWLNNPTDYFAAWDSAYRLIKGKLPTASVAGPNTSVLYSQVKGFLQHAVAANTVPDVITWHELSNPAQVRSSVAKYRAWETEVFAGTAFEGTALPININEYAFNYHTSVPGQMIQWISAIEESKVDADIAYWNIDGNLSDSAVEANRGNGQWWLLNAYAQMSGHTVAVTPPSPNTSYTLQGVATLDEDKRQSRVIIGGSAGNASLAVTNVPESVFGSTVHALIREIPWTGQLGDSAEPEVIAEADVPVEGGAVDLGFGSTLPQLKESSAYEVILTPGGHSTSPAVAPKVWAASYEAENAAHTGSVYFRNGPEGTPSNVSKFYTSGQYNIGGLRTGSDTVLDFEVTVPQDGTYDLSVLASSLNTFGSVAEQGPTNVFLRVDGSAEQELFLTLGYKWVVWDHTDTTVDLTAGTHTISLAAKSLDGVGATKGDALIDKIDLSLANPDAAPIYEAEYADLHGAQPSYDHDVASGSGAVALDEGDSATFWVYAHDDAPATLDVHTIGGGTASLAVNGVHVTDVAASTQVPVFLSGGVNKVVLTGLQGSALIDRVGVGSSVDVLATQRYEAEDGVLAGTAQVSPLSLASGGSAVTGVGGEPGNGNTLTFDDVEAAKDGTYALTFRYSNEEQSPASHYNPDPLARHADVTINGESTRVWFPHSFHRNNFWELSVPVELAAGSNTIVISSNELPNFDGETYISETFPDVLLRSELAPNLDWISVTPFTAKAPTAPDAPTAAKASSTSIAVQWAAPADDGGSAVTGYRVYENGGAAPICEVAATVTDCTVEGLALASNHAYQVAAINAVGEGPRSDASAVVTLPEVPDDDGAVTVPAKAELSASNGPRDGNFKITMNLEQGENASLFKLYENGVLVSTRWLTPSSPNPQSTSVDISGLRSGVYQYVGVLVNSKGQSSTKPVKVTVSTGK
jgi:hypothetical protein